MERASDSWKFTFRFQKTDGSPYSTIVLTGENGTGKTTILETICTFLNLGTFEPFDFIRYTVENNDIYIETREEQELVRLGYHLRKNKTTGTTEKVNSNINNNLQQMAYELYMHLFFQKKSNGKLEDIIIENPKSTIQVGEAKDADGNYPFFTSGDAVLKWREPLVDGRNCFLNTGGNADVKFYVGKTAYSTDTWCISAKSGLSDYLYLLLKSIKPELNQKFFQGTGLKHLQKPLLKERPIYIPSEDEVKAFNSSVQPWFTMISDNIRESQRLTALRDWLLPMLMNGQATIED